MKRRFSKILGAGLTLALLFSLVLTAAPVSALSVPSVTVSPATISEADADYTIRFQLDKELYGHATSAASDTAFTLSDVGDAFPITASADTDSATLTLPLTSGSVDVVLSGSGTYNTTTGVIDFAAAGEIATVTATMFDTKGVLALGGTPTVGAVVEVATDDTITITFPSGTTIAETANVTATISASSGWVGGEWVESNTSGVGVASVPDDRTVTFTLDVGNKIGEGATVRIAITAGITNPDAADDYNLTVETSQEDAETSADYEITVPDIGVLPGIVQQYNAANILMAQDTGDDAIWNMVDSAGVDYTIVVGPGEYAIAATIDLDQAGLTLKSSGDTEDTIIVADGLGADEDAILITEADVTVDGFTIQDTADGETAIMVAAAATDAIVQNNIFTAEDGWPEGIHVDGTGATVSGNELDIAHTMLVHGTDATLSDNIFGAGINLQSTGAAAPLTGITITDNTIIGSEYTGIIFEDWALAEYGDILIEGNTISETTEGGAIGIFINGAITNLQILDNEITDNEGVGILIDSTVTTPLSAIAIKFNTITGNNADNDGYGIQNDSDVATIVDATLNWWGTAVADDVAAMVNDAGTTAVTTYEPFLADTAEAVFSASDVAVGEASLDAKTTVGVKVEGATDATVIVASKYIANPQAAIADALAFYDVYVAGAIVDPTIKFYAGDANSKLYVWSADTEAWADLSEDDSFGFSVYGGYIYIDYDAELLDETPFAVVGGAVAEPGIPKILAPEVGDDTVRLRPVFAWEAVTGADGYYFQLADNASFVVPLVKMEGDTGRLSGTTYAYVGEALPYSTAYHWRVKAVSGTEAAGDLAESGWAEGVFITMDEPVEPTPPVVVEDVPPVIIEPIVEVEVITPAATEITPSWIYVIIAVGGVLVISLVVLIVRTRRVA